MKHKIFIPFFIYAFLLFFVACEESKSCFDGRQNQGELGIDCGGPCPDPCNIIESCWDGIKNQGEEGIDCGGPCDKDC